MRKLPVETINDLADEVARDANRIIPELPREVARLLARAALELEDPGDAPSSFGVTAAKHLRPVGRRDDLEIRLADVVRWNLEAA